MKATEIRKNNLTKQIGDTSQRGRVADFAREHNLDATYIRQILSNHRTMGEKSARNFEKILGLLPLELDKSPGNPFPTPLTATEAALLELCRGLNEKQFGLLFSYVQLLLAASGNGPGESR